MEQISKDPRKMKSVVNIKDDSFMEQVQPLCMEDFELEEHEAKFPSSEEYVIHPYLLWKILTT